MTLVPRLRPPRREQLPEWFACAFAAGVALLHPLIFDDFFFNINRFKFGVFAVSAYAGLIVFLLLCAARRRALAGEIRQPFSLSAADWGMGAFAVLAAASTILSDDAFSALTGDEGRLCGLVFVLALAAMRLWPDATLSLKDHACARLAAHPLLFAALSLLLTAAAYGLLHTRREKPVFPAPRTFLLTLLACAIVALAAAAALFLFYTYVDTDTKLTGMLKLFRFRDKWGTNRGGVWVRCMKLFAQSDWRVKLFGFGPDLLKKPLADAYGAEIAAYCNLSFNNAHNEYIQYLLTHGALGLTAYLTFAVGACASLFRRARKNAAAAGLLAGALAYLLHAAVNVNQPITTPLLFLFLSTSVSVPTEPAPARNEPLAQRPPSARACCSFAARFLAFSHEADTTLAHGSRNRHEPCSRGRIRFALYAPRKGNSPKPATRFCERTFANFTPRFSGRIAPALRVHNNRGGEIMRKLKFVRRERVARNPMPAASATEQTGLIPALPENDAQKASYQAVLRMHRQKEH